MLRVGVRPGWVGVACACNHFVRVFVDLRVPDALWISEQLGTFSSQWCLYKPKCYSGLTKSFISTHTHTIEEIRKWGNKIYNKMSHQGNITQMWNSKSWGILVCLHLLLCICIHRLWLWSKLNLPAIKKLLWKGSVFLPACSKNSNTNNVNLVGTIIKTEVAKKKL